MKATAPRQQPWLLEDVPPDGRGGAVCEPEAPAPGDADGGPASAQEESTAFASVIDVVGGAILVFALWEAAYTLLTYVAG